MTHPLILVPKIREIVFPLRKARFAGYYRLQKGKRGFPGYILDTGWMPNLITDGGLNRLGIASAFGTFVVGTGNAVPDVTDTQLQSLLASTTTTQSSVNGSSGSSPYYGYFQITKRFAEGAAAGNISEVGVGWSSTTLFSRALVVDGLGSPTTITVLSDEFLDVTYELRMYMDETDDVGTVAVTGSGTHDYTMRGAEANGTSWQMGHVGYFGVPGSANGCTVFSGPIGALTSSPSGTGDGASSYSQSAYVSLSLQHTRQATWGLNDGNVGGIRSIRLQNLASGGGSRQIEFDPIIPKDNTKTFSMGWTFSWARKIL